MVLSTSGAVIQASASPASGYSAGTVFSLTDKCDYTNNQFNGGALSGSADTYYFKITDGNGNTMPVGTTITFTSSNGILLGKTSFEVTNTNYKPGTVVASGVAGNHPIYAISVKSDAAVIGVCKDSTGHSGAIQVDVTTPPPVAGVAGTTTTASFPLID